MVADLKSAGTWKHGDTIELEVEKIGVLKNRVERQDAIAA